jgi:hypothetical protein
MCVRARGAGRGHRVAAQDATEMNHQPSQSELLNMSFEDLFRELTFDFLEHPVAVRPTTAA